MKEVNAVGITSIVPAAPGWIVVVDGTLNSQKARRNFLVAAFGIVEGIEGRKSISPVCFNEDCEGLTLNELQGSLEASGFEVNSTTLYCNGERSAEKGRV